MDDCPAISNTITLILLHMTSRRTYIEKQLFYAFCMAIGISPMDGTTNEIHMKEDMQLMDRIRSGEQIFSNREELAIIGNVLGAEWLTEDEL